MPRTRTFEPEDALDAAMNVFWRKGFAETSYDDLVTQTGVSRKGLYTVFGDKEALFLAALKHYCKTRIPLMFGTLQKEQVSLGDIHQMMLWLSDLAASGQLTQGCFMANTAADEMIRNPPIRDAYNNYLKFMIQLLKNGFSKAGLDKSTAHKLGIYYLGVLQSLQLMAHAQTDKEIIAQFTETALKEITSRMG